MKKSTRMIVAALTILGVSAGGAAYAARGDGACDGPRMMMTGKAPGEFINRKLEKLHGDLKLNAEQETAWKTWSDGMKGKMAKMQEKRPDFEAMSKLPAPERMAQMLERHKERQKEMESGLASLRDFYGKLTPEQQKTFDGFHAFGGHRQGGKPRGAKGGPDRG